MTILDSLLAERDRTVRAAEACLDAAERRGVTTTPAEYQEHLRALQELDQRVADLRTTEARNAQAEPMRSRYGHAATATVDRSGYGIDALLRGDVGAIDVDLGNVHRESRDLSVGTTTAGGHTVPQSFVNQLYAHLIESSAIRQTNVTVFATSSGEDLVVPKTTAHSTATLTAENVALTESDPAFGQTTLGAYKYGIRIDVTNELLTDSGIDLTGYLAEQAGRALGNASGAHFITGTGTGQPNGVVTTSTAGVTGGTGQSGVPTADELVDLFFSVIQPYRSRGTWMMSDSTLASVSKLKDADNNYLLRANNGGAPDSLLGRPIVVDPNVADTGLGAKSVLFGDFSNYAIRDVRGVRFERSSDFAFDRDVTVFRAILRTDGDLVGSSSAIKHYVGGAS